METTGGGHLGLTSWGFSLKHRCLLNERTQLKAKVEMERQEIRTLLREQSMLGKSLKDRRRRIEADQKKVSGHRAQQQQVGPGSWGRFSSILCLAISLPAGCWFTPPSSSSSRTHLPSSSPSVGLLASKPHSARSCIQGRGHVSHIVMSLSGVSPRHATESESWSPWLFAFAWIL